MLLLNVSIEPSSIEVRGLGFDVTSGISVFVLGVKQAQDYPPTLSPPSPRPSPTGLPALEYGLQINPTVVMQRVMVKWELGDS